MEQVPFTIGDRVRWRDDDPPFTYYRGLIGVVDRVVMPVALADAVGWVPLEGVIAVRWPDLPGYEATAHWSKFEPV